MVFLFKKEQKVVKIGDVKLGGQPGEYSPVAIGSVFYSKHPALIDEKEGKFDKELVENEINEFITVAQENNIQPIIDVVGAYPEALIKECTFIADLVECPFLVDGLNDNIRVPAMKGIAELGLLDRAILNSIDENTTKETCQKFKEIGVKNSVLLTFGIKAMFPKQKLSFLENTLIPRAEDAGVKNIIIDTAVLDLPSVSINAEATTIIKNTLGYPTGYAPANAIYGWEFIKQYGEKARCGAISSIMVNCIDAGGDFVLFGPVKFARCVIPSLALISGMQAYYRKRVLREQVPDGNSMQKVL
jgi:tetrahydromethanopterin S-methyltransferase subunit H